MMLPNCKAFASRTTPRKRSPQEVKYPNNKRHRQEPAIHISTPLPSTSLTYEKISRGATTCQRPSQGSSQLKPNPLKQTYERTSTDEASQSKRRYQSRILVNDWLNDISAKDSDQEKEPQGNPVIESVEVPPSPLESVAPIEAFDDPISQRDSQTKVSERLDPSTSAYWGTLKLNGVVLDQTGAHIPYEVQKLIDTHIRKTRNSPRLDEQGQTKIKDHAIRVWHKAENTVSSIFESPLFDLRDYTLAEGGNTLWTRQPLPRNPNAPLPILTPKPDKHFGFPLALDSGWSVEELSVAEHPVARPYAQPSRENMFPRMIFEFKSEATKGNLYAAEAQAAGAGAHCVSSYHWLLDVVEANHEPASTDALAFSSVVSQREVVVYVHFYDPAKKIFYMSFVDAFYYIRDTDAQGCRDHHKNVAEWMLEIVEPDLRDLLTKAHPFSKLWKKGRSASAMVDTNESSANDDGHSHKSQRTEPETDIDTQTQPDVV